MIIVLRIFSGYIPQRLTFFPIPDFVIEKNMSAAVAHRNSPRMLPISASRTHSPMDNKKKVVNKNEGLFTCSLIYVVINPKIPKKDNSPTWQ